MPAPQTRTWKTLVNDGISYWLLIVTLGITLISLTSSLGENLVLELLCSFKIQYLAISVLIFGLLAITRRKSLLLISLICVVINLADVIPWYISSARIKSTSPYQLRILSANVNTQNKSYEKILSQVKKEQPDIAVFMEIDDIWIQQLASLSEIFPYSIEQPNPYNLGIAVYSKLPLENSHINLFGTMNNPSILADIVIDKTVISLIATHPLPPIRQTFFSSRNQQLKKIESYIRQLRNSVIMVGDLNITMWSSYYKKFIKNTGMYNTRKGFGILPTWPQKSAFSPVPTVLAPLLSIPIDHCLVSPEIKVAKTRTGHNIDSDHLPLIVDLVIPQK